MKDKNGHGFYLTTKTTKKPGVAFSLQAEVFTATNTPDAPYLNIDRTYLNGPGYELLLGIGPVGGAYTVDNPIYNGGLYQMYTISVGIGIDIGFVDWDTNTRVTGGN